VSSAVAMVSARASSGFPASTATSRALGSFATPGRSSGGRCHCDLVLAAMRGATELDEGLSGRVQRSSVAGAPPGPSTAGAFIKVLSVQGFRGVGPETRVNFPPSPGFTIVAGRNGSGKSKSHRDPGRARSRRVWASRDQGSWPPGESNSQAAQVTYQHEGEKEKLAGSRGWAERLEMYRPILS
jgi:hypothetical protein